MVQFTDTTYTQQQLCCICQEQNQSKEKQLWYEEASCKSYPLSVPQGYVAICTLGHWRWQQVWRGYPVEGY